MGPLPFSGSSRLERTVSTTFSTSSLLQTFSWTVLNRSLFKLSSSLTPASPLSWGGERSCLKRLLPSPPTSSWRTRAKALTKPGLLTTNNCRTGSLETHRGCSTARWFFSTPGLMTYQANPSAADTSPQGLIGRSLSLSKGCQVSTYQGSACGCPTMGRVGTWECSTCPPLKPCPQLPAWVWG